MVGWGDCFVQFVTFPDGTLMIFGEVPPLEERLEEARRAGASDEELAVERKLLTTSMERGMLPARCYSVACPRGELGDSPARTAVAITREQFEAARQQGWDPWAFVRALKEAG